MSKEKVNNNVEETKKCKFCYSDININASVCPNCKRQQNNSKVSIIASILSLIVFLGIAYFGWQLAKPLFFSKPDYKDFSEYKELNVTSLHNDYISNEISAKDKYTGNYYYITNNIHDITEFWGDNYLEFKYKVKTDNIEINAYFDNENDIKNVKVGDKVTVYCKFKQRSLDDFIGTTSYSLEDCRIK